MSDIPRSTFFGLRAGACFAVVFWADAAFAAIFFAPTFFVPAFFVPAFLAVAFLGAAMTQCLPVLACGPYRFD
ncbi:hypothetical protein ACFQHZ_10525 [Marivibrio halodurans]|uniref:hypothetical protein n=1 Tax=Marivibrio halodurans TaxID=2039722 RepID=UPI001FE8B543|nr:hypothetical protein [Marivibrio halodurans]